MFKSLISPDYILWLSNCIVPARSAVLFPSSRSLFSEYLVALMQMSTLSEAFPTPFPTPGKWEFLPSLLVTNWHLYGFVPETAHMCCVQRQVISFSHACFPFCCPISTNASTLQSVIKSMPSYAVPS